MSSQNFDASAGLVSDVCRGLKSRNLEMFRRYVYGDLRGRFRDTDSVFDPNSVSSSDQGVTTDLDNDHLQMTRTARTRQQGNHRVEAPITPMSSFASIPSYWRLEDEDTLDDAVFISEVRGLDSSNGEESEKSCSESGEGKMELESTLQSLRPVEHGRREWNFTSSMVSEEEKDSAEDCTCGEEHNVTNDVNPSQGHSENRSDILDNVSHSVDGYAKMLVKNANEPLVFGGSSGNIDIMLAENLNIDSLFLPIRKNGFFSEGVKLRQGPKYVYLHPRDMLSHAYLKTHIEGVLHVLPGWDHRTFIRDVSYRWGHTQSYKAPVPFLGGEICQIRTMKCLGVFVCPGASEKYRYSRHSDVDPEDRNILSSISEEEHPDHTARKKVEAIYLSLKKREEGKRGCICGVPMPDSSDLGRIVACRGKAKLVLSARADSSGLPGRPVSGALSRCNYFIGCTGYRKEHAKMNVRHYCRRLDIDNNMVPYLRALMSGEVEVLVDPGSCTFVREKLKEKQKCPKHGLKLEEVTCSMDNEKGVSNHTMKTFEPVAMSGIPLERKVLYVVCKGEHLHPPPPPPEATIKKLQILESVYKETGIRACGQLRKEVQKRLLEASDGKHTGGKKAFNGSIRLPTNMVRNTLNLLKPRAPKLAVEIGELAVMVADTEIPYVRGSKMADGGYVFFLAHDDLLAHACTAKSFAGDATFKTVTESNRAIRTGRWYLYNIVAHASNERLNGSTVVVLRALMMGLSKAYYYEVWRFFLTSLAQAKKRRKGDLEIDGAEIKLPYLPSNDKTVESDPCLVTSITIDFDSAELHGCAQALQAVCGGTLEDHYTGIFIGCEVHLQRDLVRRANKGDIQKAAGMTKQEILEQYFLFVHANSSSKAKEQLDRISTFDSSWVKWVRSQNMGPLISSCLSNMSPSDRTVGFFNTNAVESQNRRGNQLVGTRLNPAEAARKLGDLDYSDGEILKEGYFDHIPAATGKRKRKDSLLRPSLSGNNSTKKRSKRGGVLAPKRRPKEKTVKSKKSTIAPEKNSGDRNMDQNRDNEHISVEGTIMGKERQYQDITTRLQSGVATLSEKLKQSGIDGKISIEQRKARMDTIVEIMTGAQAAAAIDKVELVKKSIVGALQSNRDDIEFREALLELFVYCTSGCQCGNVSDGTTSLVRNSGNEPRTFEAEVSAADEGVANIVRTKQ